MPLYEYRCQSCGAKEEKLEGFSAPTEHDCPQCGRSLAMRREVSLTSFALVGGGWHAQGYSAGSASKPGKSSAEPAPAAGGCAGGCACHKHGQ